MDLKPLLRSAEYDDLEAELKQLFVLLYGKHIDPAVESANTMGMPHLGPDEFISLGLNNDGLALLNDTTNDKTRMLFMAWRYLNPQRGTSFLRFYLRALFGNVFTIEQLWCLKDGVYPVDVMSKTDILSAGKDLADYFLTSRLRVDIETEIVPQRILTAARTAVAARFVLDLRAARRITMNIPLLLASNAVQVIRSTGKAIYQQPPIESPVTVGQATQSGVASFVFSSSARIDMQTVRK
jgi:hypothetical protein